MRPPDTPSAALPVVKVSVCVPTYNGEKFIAQTVQSVLEQTYRDFELLVVDDGSTDGTRDVAGSFADPRVRVHRNAARRGIPGNWNRCLELARGEYVCVFHQDDRMRPGNLEKKVRALDADPGVSFVYSAAAVLREDSAPALLADWSGPEDFVRDGDACYRRLLLHGNTVCCPTVVTRRRLLLEAGGFCEQFRYACDYEAWLRLCLAGRVAFLKEPLVEYRWHSGNASHSFQDERGLEEVFAAGERTLPLYLERTGRHGEKEVLETALAAVAAGRRWALELEKSREWHRRRWLEQQEANAALRASWTWRAGRLLTGLPAALKRALRRAG